MNRSGDDEWRDWDEYYAGSRQKQVLDQLQKLRDQGMAKVKIHESITEDRVIVAINRSNITLDNPGICLACGEDTEGCEPDAERYECSACDRKLVFGAEQILLCGHYHKTKVSSR